MRILLIGFGSRGDVQPLIALGRGLAGAGFDTAVAAGVNFRGMVQAAGLAFEPIRTDVQALMRSDAGKRWAQDSRGNPIREARNMRRMIDAAGSGIGEDLLRAAGTADVLVSGLPTFGMADAIARRLDKRHLTVLLTPLHPTASHAATVAPIVPGRDAAPNRWSGFLGQYFTYWVFKQVVDRFRASLGMPRLSFRAYRTGYHEHLPVLCGFSTQVVPRPSDWPGQVHVTGYWVHDAPRAWQPPPDLADFLDAGPPPVYVGFGSMAGQDPRATTGLVIDALRRAGQRGILGTGWAELGGTGLPDTVHEVRDVPHEWLFPRVAAVIHHGGAGTTAAAFRAGVPSAAVPHMADQPYWGRRTHELGVGGKPIPRRRLTTERLASTIRDLIGNPGRRDRAAALGRALRAEDGVADAVDVISGFVGYGGAPR